MMMLSTVSLAAGAVFTYHQNFLTGALALVLWIPWRRWERKGARR